MVLSSSSSWPIKSWWGDRGEGDEQRWRRRHGSNEKGEIKSSKLHTQIYWLSFRTSCLPPISHTHTNTQTHTHTYTHVCTSALKDTHPYNDLYYLPRVSKARLDLQDLPLWSDLRRS